MEIEGDAGGIVSAEGRSMNGSFELTGSAFGEGRFSRITEIEVNDVRMKERISASEGTLDSEERIIMISEAVEDPESELIGSPGTLTYSISIEEPWPVLLKADRKMDYIGSGICDREAFGNDLDFAGASYLYNTDLRKDRNLDIWLNRTTFLGMVTDDPSEVAFLPPNRVISEKGLNYSIESLSDGLATLSYRQAADDRSIAGEGTETYCGSFRIARTISMTSSGMDEEENETEWLSCCLGGRHVIEVSAGEPFVFGGL